VGREVEIFDLRDVKRIGWYSGGMHLYFDSGNIRHKRISTGTLSNEDELKKEICRVHKLVDLRGGCEN
jgi:hypothetical protein